MRYRKRQAYPKLNKATFFSERKIERSIRALRLNADIHNEAYFGFETLQALKTLKKKQNRTGEQKHVKWTRFIPGISIWLVRFRTRRKHKQEAGFNLAQRITRVNKQLSCYYCASLRNKVLGPNKIGTE